MAVRIPALAEFGMTPSGADAASCIVPAKLLIRFCSAGPFDASGHPAANRTVGMMPMVWDFDQATMEATLCNHMKGRVLE